MGRHTPGPWRAVGRRGSYTSAWYIESETGRSVANLDTSQLDPKAASHGEGEANARLIAAAPDLLEELKKMTEHFRDCCLKSGDVPEYAASSIARANAIIARLEGKTTKG